VKHFITRLTLSQRLSAVFAVLLLACCGTSAWLQVRSNESHEQEVIQRLSIGLAGHIAENSSLMEARGVNSQAVKALFGKLMDVNPSVEVYLLAPDGRIEAQAAPAGHLKRNVVDVAPIRRLLSGAALPVLGDDPRGESSRKVFSAAPVRVDGRDIGYVYVVLQGEDHDALAQHVSADNALRTTLLSMALMAAFGLLAGLAAFHWITRPLRQLTDDVHRLQANGTISAEQPGVSSGAGSISGPVFGTVFISSSGPGADRSPVAPTVDAEGDEIAVLRHAFDAMTLRIADQWRELATQDQQRREMVANISHDLRTPLTSLHGYLETLRVKAESLSDAERKRYLDVALGQSRKVGRLAQELFELARLECGVVKPDIERFSLPELVQDVFHKFELAAEANSKLLVPDIGPDLPMVAADVGLIERVLTNLLDNAVRHTPPGGHIEVRLRQQAHGVAVRLSDTGPGIPPSIREHLFVRPSFHAGHRSIPGGLGLLIVQRILQLHDSEIRLAPSNHREGAVFEFSLSA
jgi:signal transduction histidine kinase